MNNRKAFTLVELLVVIGIIALLAGLLLPMVNHMQRSARITSEKADFQSISTALEQYKSDFGDYPRNTNLPTWNTSGSPALAAPIFFSLGTALLGPGPASTQLIPPTTSNLEIGDGSDGPGFRCQTSGAIPNDPNSPPVSVSAGAITVTFTVNPQYLPQAKAFAANFVNAPSASSASPTPASITFLPSPSAPNDPYPETAGIATVSLTGNQLMLNFSAPTSAPHQGNCLVIPSSGKVWGPYISADTFKVAFVPSTDVNNAAINQMTGGYGQPILLDRWGQAIQYFPTYGTVSNRTNDSVLYNGAPTATKAAVLAGPLFGYSQPLSIDNRNGENTIWDMRDGAPFFTISGASTTAWANPVSGVGTVYCQQWQDTAAQPFFIPEMAIQWMLGVTNIAAPSITNPTGNVIAGSDKLSFAGPFILISAGPDGPNRANGGFCNMADPASATPGTPLPTNVLQQTFINSGNIYNFDRQ